jgi:8-oxo-dGTP diphosphatase
MKQVTAAILINDGLILIAKRKALDSLGGRWEFPGGTVEDGESPEECLKREMYEEFQILVSIGEYLGESEYHYDHDWIRLLAYRACWESGDIVAKVHADYRWVSREELSNYFFSPADQIFVERLIDGEIKI